MNLQPLFIKTIPYKIINTEKFENKSDSEKSINNKATFKFENINEIDSTKRIKNVVFITTKIPKTRAI